MRPSDKRCPKCSNYQDVRADFCTQPRMYEQTICQLAILKTNHQHFRCKKCKHKWLEITEMRRLNIDE